jgi:hypothetical protein
MTSKTQASYTELVGSIKVACLSDGLSFKNIEMDKSKKLAESKYLNKPRNDEDIEVVKIQQSKKQKHLEKQEVLLLIDGK